MKKFKIIALTMACVMALSGCSLGRTDTDAEKLEYLRADGTITYQESTLGIPVNTKDITEQMISGMFYVLHEDTFYPLYLDYENDPEVPDEEVDNTRFMVYDSETIINIPTLFEGDKLYYFSTAGVTDYFVVERYKDLGWSIGLRNLLITESEKRVYLDLEDEDEGLVILSPEFADLPTVSKEQLLLDKIGGVRITPDFVENGIVVGLTEGANYDVEIYNGTNYYYYNADCNIRYFQAMELYALDEFEPLQDYLYEVTIPDYFLPGYYNFGGAGLVRITKAPSYDDMTDFNEKLLFAYYPHDEGDTSFDEVAPPGRYSENPNLNEFLAYDEGYFGYVDPLTLEEEQQQEEIPLLVLDDFREASTTKTELWLPAGKDCSISVVTPETTGSIYLVMENGSRKMLVYNRLNGAYELTITGKDAVGTLRVQGLFNNYTIQLVNAQSYNGQDALLDTGAPADDAAGEESEE